MVEAAGQQDARSSNSQPSTLHDEEEEEDDWDHTHPCFPHPNPHVPLDSQLYQTTKVIRIPRDYMINGDNTPAYSIVYPVILDPYVTEEQFRKIIDTVNEKLRLAFDPWNKWNWIDAAVGLTTLWFWEEIFPTYVKRRLREVELVLDQWNQTLAEQGAKLIALRRTGYISLDIQIPDPLREESEDGSIVGPLGQGVPTNGATANGTTENGTTITDERKRAMSNAGTIPRLTINGDYAK
ncbi:Golgin subfamily A member 7/ERF4 family-domain-containing protein [Kalaharituber pfeilii]|nr:Golgin subfamily A member 7/ERF4 family-domain-containing protein [Kalaharituber pfeilii]